MTDDPRLYVPSHEAEARAHNRLLVGLTVGFVVAHAGWIAGLLVAWLL